MGDVFRPWFWLRNPHVQTVLGVFCKGKAFPHRTVRRRVRLSDGDQLVLHDTTPPAWRPGDPVAVLVHGLGGSHRSGGIVRLARLLLRPGVRAGGGAGLFPDPHSPFPGRLSLRLFADLYTARRGGFRDANDYYARASSAAFMPRVQLPTLILTARDDPFVAWEPIARLECR